jgi:hypothetical protein
MRRAAVVLPLVAVACGSPAAAPGGGGGEEGGGGPGVAVAGGTAAGGAPPACVAAQAATAADRALIGQASPYPADGALRARDAELAASPSARREVAWQIVERVLAPVGLEGALPNAAGATVPRFLTWYAKDDVGRLFHHLYEGIGRERRQLRDGFTDAELDAAFAWNPRAVEDDPAWPADRLAAYAASLDAPDEVGGLGGVARVAYSPGAARHLLRSYRAVVACDGAAPPPPVADLPAPGPRRAAHVTAELARCERRAWGPYFVGDGEELQAAIDGAARLELVDDGGVIRCAGDVGEPCRAAGPRALHVVATAAADGEVAVNVDYAEANPVWAACLDGPFPIDAAVVKAEWRRVWPGDPLPTYDTSAAGLARRRSGDVSWDVPDGHAEPAPGSIFTVTTPAGSTFRLAGLHVMTKELDHWAWVSLFWSPEPGGHLGGDRPAAIDALGGPWAHYAMCAVTSFDEPDGSPTWCSNPYIEDGPGNAATNCIGCHQHGGTGLPPGSILATFDDFGTRMERNNFPADYGWSLDQGDLLLRMFADEVAWWDTEP